MINGELIDLVAGDYEARIASSGAMLVHLRRQGRDLIMPFDAEATLPAGWQGKTLLPWANRIAGSRYDYAGTEFLVGCNEPASGSALHGLAGWMDWQVADDDPSGPDDGAPRSRVVLELSLLASYGYPWSLEASACFELDAERGLSVTVTATNVGAARPAPPPSADPPHHGSGVCAVAQVVSLSDSVAYGVVAKLGTKLLSQRVDVHPHRIAEQIYVAVPGVGEQLLAADRSPAVT